MCSLFLRCFEAACCGGGRFCRELFLQIRFSVRLHPFAVVGGDVYPGIADRDHAVLGCAGQLRRIFAFGSVGGGAFWAQRLRQSSQMRWIVAIDSGNAGFEVNCFIRKK